MPSRLGTDNVEVASQPQTSSVKSQGWTDMMFNITDKQPLPLLKLHIREYVDYVFMTGTGKA